MDCFLVNVARANILCVCSCTALIPCNEKERKEKKKAGGGGVVCGGGGGGEAKETKYL